MRNNQPNVILDYYQSLYSTPGARGGYPRNTGHIGAGGADNPTPSSGAQHRRWHPNTGGWAKIVKQLSGGGPG